MKGPRITMCVCFFLSVFFKVYLSVFERKRENTGQRERIPSRLCTVRAEPDAGLKLTNCEIMT